MRWELVLSLAAEEAMGDVCRNVMNEGWPALIHEPKGYVQQQHALQYRERNTRNGTILTIWKMISSHHSTRSMQEIDEQQPEEHADHGWPPSLSQIALSLSEAAGGAFSLVV